MEPICGRCYLLRDTIRRCRTVLVNDKIRQQIERRVQVIEGQYGQLLTLSEVAEVLKYRTVGAARKAHDRGQLPVNLYRFDDRKGLFAKANELAEALELLGSSQSVPSSTTKDEGGLMK